MRAFLFFSRISHTHQSTLFCSPSRASSDSTAPARWSSAAFAPPGLAWFYNKGVRRVSVRMREGVCVCVLSKPFQNSFSTPHIVNATDVARKRAQHERGLRPGQACEKAVFDLYTMTTEKKNMHTHIHTHTHTHTHTRKHSHQVQASDGF